MENPMVVHRRGGQARGSHVQSKREGAPCERLPPISFRLPNLHFERGLFTAIEGSARDFERYFLAHETFQQEERVVLEGRRYLHVLLRQSGRGQERVVVGRMKDISDGVTALGPLSGGKGERFFESGRMGREGGVGGGAYEAADGRAQGGARDMWRLKEERRPADHGRQRRGGGLPRGGRSGRKLLGRRRPKESIRFRRVAFLRVGRGRGGVAGGDTGF
jgi:hypothetical protein